jgi:iron complex outermembrane receptor protein
LAKLSKQWEISGNVSFSNNRNLDFRIENDTEVKNLGNTQISFLRILSQFRVEIQSDKNFQFALMNQYVGKQYLDNSEDKNLQLKDYLLTDFNAQYQFKIAHNEVALKLLVNNIFNKKYVNNGAVWDGNPYYFSQAGTNFMLGVSWKIH